MRRAALLAAPLLVFVVASGRLLSPAIVLAALVALGIAWLATRHPEAAAPIAIVGIVCIPVYWGRAIGGLGLAVIPATIAGAVLIPTALREGQRLRIVVLDVLVVGYVVVRSLAFILNFSSGLGAAVGFSSRILLVYASFRLLSVVPGARRRMAVALVVAGGLLAIPAYFERTRPNLFFDLVTPGYQAGSWVRPELRLDSVRLEGSFGHPIPFGMFLAVVVVLSVALAVSTRHRHQVVGFLTIAGIATATLLGTLSRGPMLVAAAALVAWLLLEVWRMSPGRVGAIAVGLVAVLVLTPALSVVDSLWTASSGDTREARSAEYRLEVASVVFDAEQFSVLGRSAEGTGEVSRVGAERVGLKSVDNEYAIVFLAGGLLSLVVFVAIGLQVLLLALRRRLDAVDRAWMVVLVASFLNLATVALLTQFSDLFWISVAVAASIAQERTEPAGADSTFRRDRVGVPG